MKKVRERESRGKRGLELVLSPQTVVGNPEQGILTSEAENRERIEYVSH